MKPSIVIVSQTLPLDQSHLGDYIGILTKSRVRQILVGLRLLHSRANSNKSSQNLLSLNHRMQFRTVRRYLCSVLFQKLNHAFILTRKIQTISSLNFIIDIGSMSHQNLN